MLTVPLLDLKAQYAQIRAEVLPIIDEVCASQRFILGEHVGAFEQEMARYCAAAHSVGVSSGTDALLLALMTLGIGAGDEVVTSPFTFFATGGTIARSGARPVFCDIERSTFNISASAVREFLERQCERRQGQLVNRTTGGRVRALMPVHLYGQAADMNALRALAHEHGLKIIEDAAQAIGTEYQGKRVGALGDIGCFSYFPSKNLGAFGDAGHCTTNDPDLAEMMRVLRVHGGKPKYYHSYIGGNFRIDELQAAVLRVKLRHLETWTAGRQKNAAFYTAALTADLIGQLTPPHVAPGGRHIFNQYVIRTPRRDTLRDFLSGRGIGTEIYYPVSLHQQPCFAYLGYQTGDFPEAESAAAEALALPIYPELANEQLEHVVTSIREFFS